MLLLNYTSSYVEDGGEAKSVAASRLVTQPMSANVRHLRKEKTIIIIIHTPTTNERSLITHSATWLEHGSEQIA